MSLFMSGFCNLTNRKGREKLSCLLRRRCRECHCQQWLGPGIEIVHRSLCFLSTAETSSTHIFGKDFCIT